MNNTTISSQSNKPIHNKLHNKLHAKIQEKKLYRTNSVVRNKIIEDNKKNVDEYMQLKRENDIKHQKEIRNAHLENMKLVEANIAQNINSDNFNEIVNTFNEDNLPDISDE